MVQYWYDAWGNHKVVDSNGNEITNANHIGNLNPFRYRGYYYDRETGLYFLQTRYYDPEIGRFLNRDSVAYADPQTINGLNLYAYCLNNPIAYTDNYGCSSWMDSWWGKALGWLTTAVLVVGAVVAIGAVAIGTVASGGLLGAVLVGGGVGVLAGVTGNIVSQGGLANLGNINPWAVALSGTIGGVVGVASGALSFGLTQIGQFIGQQVGFALSNATHLSSGVNIAKTFGFSIAGLMSTGSLIGGAIGGTVGGILANDSVNYFAKEIFGEEYIVNNPNYIRSSLLKIFNWLNSFI